ncbi:ORC ubiquitin ligase 1-like [Ylistrum balloti]|uniref:ORC ubiquitin ligase 1-like n=1 Tax=Ylistrum balloti TaxID=509963 RepID=UPI002905E527|nr:ORC ubiquitin ligase 1-like [Ylistrum balloti]
MSRFDVEKFNPAPDPDLICCICQCVLDSPMESPCRHVFCKICIETWLTNHHNCPTCRRSLRTRRLKPVLPIVQNMINRLQMSCDFSKNGCKEILLLEQYDSHLKVCDYEKLKCRFSKCGIELLRKDLSEHEEELCEFREKQCNKQCGLMIPISVFDTHDCFKELQKFATESTALVETLKKSVKELTELTKTMKKNLEDLSRELQGRRRHSPFPWTSPTYSPSYTTTDYASDGSNFILDDYSNERFDDVQNTDRSIQAITNALQRTMDQTRDQRNVRLRNEIPSRNSEEINLIQPGTNVTNQDIVNARMEDTGANQASVMSNTNDVNGNRILGVSSAAGRQPTSEPRQDSHQSNGDISTTRAGSRSRSHIWDSDISVLSSSSSSSSSSSDDDVDRDFGIDQNEDEERDRNSDAYTYSFSPTPINSPNRSIRSPSSSGSTIHFDDQRSQGHGDISSLRATNRSMSEIYSGDEGDRSYCSSSSEYRSQARVQGIHHLSYSSDQHNHSSQSVDSRRNTYRFPMDRSGNQSGDDAARTSNPSLNQSCPSSNYEIGGNTDIDQSNYILEAVQECSSSIGQSSHSENSRWEGHISGNRIGSSVAASSDKKLEVNTDQTASLRSDGANPQNLTNCCSDQEKVSEDLKNEVPIDQNDVILVSIKNGTHPFLGGMHHYSDYVNLECKGNIASVESASGGMSSSVSNDYKNTKTNTTSPHGNLVNNVEENRYVEVERVQESSSTSVSPSSHSTHWPRKRKHDGNRRSPSISNQECSPSSKKRMMNFDKGFPGRKSSNVSVVTTDNADEPKTLSSHQNTAEGASFLTWQQQDSALSLENMRASIITSSNVGEEMTCVTSNNTSISVSSQDSCRTSNSKDIVTNNSNSSSQATEKYTDAGNIKNEIPVSEKNVTENQRIDSALNATFDLHGYNSDTDDTWEPQDSVGNSDSDLDYQEMTPDSDVSDDTNDAWQNTIHRHQSVTVNTGNSQSQHDDTWEPRISTDGDSTSDDDDSYLSELDIDTDSSYEVRIPMSVAQLLDKYASDDHDSDDSWTPH